MVPYLHIKSLSYSLLSGFTCPVPEIHVEFFLHCMYIIHNLLKNEQCTIRPWDGKTTYVRILGKLTYSQNNVSSYTRAPSQHAPVMFVAKQSKRRYVILPSSCRIQVFTGYIVNIKYSFSLHTYAHLKNAKKSTALQFLIPESTIGKSPTRRQSGRHRHWRRHGARRQPKVWHSRVHGDVHGSKLDVQGPKAPGWVGHLDRRGRNLGGRRGQFLPCRLGLGWRSRCYRHLAPALWLVHSHLKLNKILIIHYSFILFNTAWAVFEWVQHK